VVIEFGEKYSIVQVHISLVRNEVHSSV